MTRRPDSNIRDRFDKAVLAEASAVLGDMEKEDTVPWEQVKLKRGYIPITDERLS
ncbi:MAG: hypothetical protein FJY97_01150 [candidate division Zixibacteria bacterium]|nr:hypothetical protein [candidate division Zixibacteria bacterium]